MSRNDIIMGLVALVLVVFSLVIALVVPRRNPGFPGKSLRVFVVVAVALVAGMLATVEILGGEEEDEAEAGEIAEPPPAEGESPAPPPAETEAPPAEPPAPAGEPAAGKEVFASAGCGACHTLADAGSSGTIGPDLDTQLPADAQKANQPLPEFALSSIVDPNLFVAEGFQPNIMPTNYGQQLSEEQLTDLVAFLTQR